MKALKLVFHATLKYRLQLLAAGWYVTGAEGDAGAITVTDAGEV